MQREDLTGKKFGKLTVVEMLYNFNGTKTTKCRCTCDCGKENVIRIAYELKQATDSSCGCGKKAYVRKSRGKEIDGQKFGRLTVLETLWNEPPVKVKCKCECGTIGVYNKVDVMTGHTKSCGCYARERTGETNFINHAGKVSDYGVKIIEPAFKNEKKQWVWNCQCGFCGRVFQMLPARVLNNHVRSCGCLRDSSREVFIERSLVELGINYDTEYKFKDLRSECGYPLRFDFVVFDNNDKIKCLIEYDGQQHYKAIDIFGGDEALDRNKRYDRLKNEYCQKNGLLLYRIPYTMTEEEIRERITNIVNP